MRRSESKYNVGYYEFATELLAKRIRQGDILIASHIISATFLCTHLYLAKYFKNKSVEGKHPILAEDCIIQSNPLGIPLRILYLQQLSASKKEKKVPFGSRYHTTQNAVVLHYYPQVDSVQ